MSDKSKKIIITSAITCGLLALAYASYRIIKKRNKRKCSESPVRKTKYQVVSNHRIEEDNRISLCHQVEIFIPNIIENTKFKNLNNQKQYKSRDESLSKLKKDFRDSNKGASSTNVKSAYTTYLKEKDDVYSHPKTECSPNKSTKNDDNRNNYDNKYINSTLIQLVNDIKDPNKSTNVNFQDLCGSINLPLNTNDLDDELRLAEAGYMEEDDDDFRSSEVSGGFFGLNNEDKRNLAYSDEDDIPINKSVFEDKKIALNTNEDLEKVLFPKTAYEINPNQTYIIKTIKLTDNKIVIESSMFIIILKSLHSELNNGLIELGDAFSEERRKYFISNFDTYLSIVDYYLKSKDEFFLAVLTQIMSKLSIEQQLLDDTFDYYLNSNEETKEIIEIKQAYSKAAKSGLKYTIAPKVLTKLKLKNILKYQVQAYEEVISKYPQLNKDIIEIIVNDKLYLEFGFEKEAIIAASIKHCITQDESFAEILTQLSEYKDNSLLNI